MKDITQLHLLVPWSRVHLEKLIVLELVKQFLHFMTPQGLLPCSQLHTLPSYLIFNFILSFCLCLHLAIGLLPLGFSPKLCMVLCSLPYLLHAVLLSSSIIITDKSTNHGATVYPVSTSLPLLPSSNTQYKKYHDSVFYIEFFICLLMIVYFLG